MSSTTTDMTVGFDDPILVTGGAGFIGSRVVSNLCKRGFRQVRCLARRPQTNSQQSILSSLQCPPQVILGNLLSRDDCERAARDVKVVFHLAAGTGQKSFADAFLNSVVTTRNLLDASVASGSLRRFVSISSFAVYSNQKNQQPGLLDESCALREHPEFWGDAYCYAKIKQDETVEEYGRKHGISYILLRPGAVYGPGKRTISARVGIGTFGLFLHLGGGGQVPITYVDNCADAVVLAGLRNRVESQVLNIVDDDLPTSRQFLRLYKQNVERFRSLYLPQIVSYLLCYLWEKCSIHSRGQLPPNYNRGAWHAYWKETRYTNRKLKEVLEWKPIVSTADGLRKYFEDCRTAREHA